MKKPRFFPARSTLLRRGPQVVAVMLILGLLGAMAIGPARLLVAQRERVDGMERDLAEIQQVNSKLRHRIERLQDPDFVEQQAREQAGLVKPGEVAYRVLPPSEDRAENKRRERQRTREEPVEEPGVMESFLRFIGFI